MEPAEFSAAVERTARRLGMDLSRPLAMVSGGPDSVALLRSLVELGGRPVVLHVDHRLRGEESREDEEFVRDLCKQLSLQYEAHYLELGDSNLQEQARRERYRIAEEIAGKKELSAIATGHIADDVAETVVLNLARGAGLRGLSGMPSKRGQVVRPLIERYRGEILRYLDHLGQTYRTDRSNLQPKYARNRVRLEVLSVLEELYPGARSNIVRGASLLRDDLESLEELAAKVVCRCGDEVLVPMPEFRMLPVALRRYAIRVAYSTLLPDAPPLGLDAVETILGLAQKDYGTRIFNPSQNLVVAVRGGTNISFYQRTEPFSGEHEVRMGGFEFAGWLVDVREVRELDGKDAARPEVAYFDASKGPFRVRMAREGDTIRPLGLGGEKKVFRAMMDRKVPKDLRRRTPVAVDEAERVAWVFLGELGEEFKVTPATEKALRVEVKKI